MSEENVEIVRATTQAWFARDIDALRELLDGDVILRTAKNWPEPGPYVGQEAVIGFFEQASRTFDAETFERTGDISHGADRVVSREIWHGQGRGPESSMEYTTIYAVRNGKVREIEFFWDHDEALEAAGLSE
jgi:ketosteroid isomerase-like protein